MDTNYKNEMNFLLKPVLILVVVLVLISLSVVLGLRNISSVRSTLDKNRSTESSLLKKVSALQTVNNVLSGDITFLDIVLPSRGSVLYALSQVRSQAVNSNLTVSNLKTGNIIPESSGVMKSTVSFEISGQESDVFSFLGSVDQMLPLMNIEKVSFSNVSGLLTANVSLNVYSAELPKTIPSVTGTVAELSNQEVQLLNELSSYKMPLFVEPQINQSLNQKTDPFN